MRTQWLIFVKLGMWVVGGTSTTYVVCLHRMQIFNTSFSYLFWLATNKKNQISRCAQVLPTWSVVTKCAYLIPHFHICSDWLLTIKIKYNLQGTSWHFPKGGPGCIFCDYSERISREPQNSSCIFDCKPDEYNM